MENKSDEPILFAVKRIKDISFAIHEDRVKPDPALQIKVEFQNTVSFNVEAELLLFTFRVYYHYENEPLENILLDSQVQNVFAVKNLKRFRISETELDLPGPLVASLTAMTISHTRALVAKNASGTVLQDVLIPISNAIDVAKHFFPKSFKSHLVPE